MITNIKIFDYSRKMGNYPSLELVEYQGNLLDYPYAWTKTKPKNFDYYFSNKRCTKISRKLYTRDYERGWFYGYNFIENPIDLEKEF